MPQTRDKSNFDIDLDFGNVSEQEIVDMFESDGRIEVKTERDKWIQTGKIVFEIKGHEGRLSGLSVTEATWWIQCLNYRNQNLMMLTFRVKFLKIVLKKMIKEKTARLVKGGDNNYSTMILAPIQQLMKEYINYDEIHRQDYKW